MADIETLDVKTAAPNPSFSLPFPVVGIGASAGGLEAVQTLLSDTTQDGPSETGIAFVLVQHLDPNHASMLADLLSRRTNLTVRQVEDGDRLAPDTLFVIPPGAGLEVVNGALKLVAFEEPRGLRRPIDDFFASLAGACGENCAAVIVSGTGSDGSAGIRAVKNAGGLVVVQEPEEAKYDGMPLAAVDTGLADKVLPARQVVGLVRDYFERPRVPGASDADAVLEHLDDITEAVTDATGHDFSGYKHSTMMRRVRRRMQIVGANRVSDYLKTLRDNPDECEALVADLLINVTQFYRDPDYFGKLRDLAIPDILRGKTRADTVRMWVPGCSSGEEAYTIAMLVAHAMRGRVHQPYVQIFATDIDEQMLSTAKLGRYPIASLSDLPEDLQDYCTIQASGHFVVTPAVRDMVRFSSHSVIKDPPFSRLDLVSCRNLLIYLNSRLQQGVIPLFHYALKPGGWLFLGPAETLGRHEELFSTESSSARLYRRREGRTPEALTLPIGGGNLRRLSSRYSSRGKVRTMAVPTPTQGLAQRRVLDAYAPAFLTVGSSGEIMESSGQLSRYFGFPSGAMTNHVSALARPGLREPLTQTLRKAMESGERQVLRGIEVKSEFGVQDVDLAVDPLPNDTYLIVLRDIAAFRASTEDDLVELPDPESAVTALEAELDTTRLKLRTTVEELETTNEELKSSNEEMMSMNEELQSANEELTTVNDELKDKVDRLARASNEQRNFLASTDLALVVVDRDLNIRTFTTAATEIYPLTIADEGRPLSALSGVMDGDGVIADARAVIETDQEISRAVTTRDGRKAYVMRILPYRDVKGVVDGASLTFIDTTKLRDARRVVDETNDRLELALSVGGIGVWDAVVETGESVLDDKVAEMFDLSEFDTHTVEQVIGQIDDRDRDRVDAAFAKAIATNTRYRTEFRIKDTDPERWLVGEGRLVKDADGHTRMTGVNYDITSMKAAEQQQDLLVQELNHRVKNLFAIVLGMLRAENRRAVDKAELVANIEARVGALSRAHEATRGAAVGNMPNHARLGQLLDLVLDPYGVGDRVRLSGGEVALPASASTPLGLILHELATNAQKYGALSNERGRIDVSWRTRDDGLVEMSWVESGGPTVKAPDRTSFGMRLIKQSVSQLGGQLELDWRPAGLQLKMSLSLEHVT